ncbi:MAG: crotonyl-CoA carboxylase/reductase [Chloroflexi bacterium RBG_16_68_14]|nr:MAG: crotonyl-CoA carboxylase/reductase [Chloroflexi bacterium RBG_16_68_14]
MTTETKDLYEIGEIPPIGQVPPYMYAQVIRRERFGEPSKAFAREKVPVPDIGPNEALVYVMAAGINYNNVWAALGVPVDVIRVHAQMGDDSGFHIGGSDASGIVYAVGSDVTNVKVGDRVVVHCGWWDEDDPFIKAGGDPILAPSNKIWGYETNWGSFAQFTKAQAHQCLPKPPHLTWEAAAAYMLVGATAYRMLTHWSPHTVQPGDVVLVWGGSGGLGSMAIQIARALGGVPVAVTSSEEKGEYCKRLGAAGYVNRKQFDHWGMPPHWTDEEGYGRWIQGARAFGKALWDVLGERRNPRIVFEHPGEDTIPTSIFVCDNGGMVVICAGTTGYNAVVDLRYLWMRQKRLQGSHFANDAQAAGINQLVTEQKVAPALSKVYQFDEVGLCHQLMYEGKQPDGNMAVLVNATRPGLTEVA